MFTADDRLTTTTASLASFSLLELEAPVVQVYGLVAPCAGAKNIVTGTAGRCEAVVHEGRRVHS
jgi:hypothetical protein